MYHTVCRSFRVGQITTSNLLALFTSYLWVFGPISLHQYYTIGLGGGHSLYLITELHLPSPRHHIAIRSESTSKLPIILSYICVLRDRSSDAVIPICILGPAYFSDKLMVCLRKLSAFPLTASLWLEGRMLMIVNFNHGDTTVTRLQLPRKSIRSLFHPR